MSRGYYGLIGNQIYEIISSDYNTTAIITPFGNRMSTKESGQAIHDVNIKLSNLSTNSATNKEIVDEAIAKLQTDKTKKITALDSVCKVFLSYRVISGTPDAPVTQEGHNSPVVDEGCLVSNITLHPALFSLGLTLENEYVSRWALTTGIVKFERNFVQGVPLGISRHRQSDYTLLIDRIVIVQKKYDDIRDVCIHPSIEYYNDIHPASGNVVTLYDSNVEGIELSPVYFNAAPKKITIHLEIDLNDYFVVADRDDIVAILNKNIEDEKNADDNKGELTPDHKDDKSDIGSDKSDNTGSEGDQNPPKGDGNPDTSAPSENPGDTKTDPPAGTTGDSNPDTSSGENGDTKTDVPSSGQDGSDTGSSNTTDQSEGGSKDTTSEETGHKDQQDSNE